MQKTLVALLVLGVVLVGCVQQAPSPTPTPTPFAPTATPTPTLAAGAVVEISIENLQFIPNRVKVEKGTTVRWTNRDTVAHTIFVTDLETESRVINPGESYQFTFSQDAFLGYICGIHPFMTASLLVGAAVDPFPKNVTPEGPPPRVISIEPNRAPADTAGTEIAIKGENFRNGSTAFFHHLFGKVTFIDSNMLHVKTPSHYADKTGVIVTNPDGQFHNFTDFTFYQTTTTPTPTQQPSELGVEVRTIHFVSSTPAHGVTLTSSPAVVAVDFNFQVVQTSNIRVFRGTEIVAQGGVAAGNNLRLEVKPPNLSPGVYKVEYHAVWPGGSFHDGQFYFRIA